MRNLLMLVACCVSLVAVVHAETLRDPFTFSPQEEPETAVVAPAVVLMGVLWDAARPLAIVGDQEVGVGDQVADWQVVEIQENGMIVQRGDRREAVSIGSRLPSD